MIYFYDGSETAFLTAFVLSYRDEQATLVSGNAQLSLGQETVFVRADETSAARARERLLRYDKDCMHDLSMLLRSGDPERDRAALGYFRLIAKKKCPVRGMFAEPAVIETDTCLRRIGTELEHLRGFVRFLVCESGALYAPISPDHDIADLLLPHFRARLPLFPFAIHDVRRKKAAVYDGKNSFVAPLDRAEVILSADEENWKELWKDYYRSVNIPSRERLKQMRGYMPVRYWKFMPEKSL